MTLRISTDAHTKLLRLAQGNPRAQREVARVFAYLKSLGARLAKTTVYWNVDGSASGVLTSAATLQNGTPIWRLYPTHVHCIALLAMQDETLFVLDFCSKAEIKAIERKLSIDCDLTI